MRALNRASFNAPCSLITLLSKMKVGLNIIMAAAEDVETQQKGLVVINYQLNPFSRIFANKSEREEARRTMSCFPIRVSAIHLCLPDNPAFSVIRAVVMASATPEVRTRMRFHSGKL
jgi:hypothetical protein